MPRPLPRSVADLQARFLAVLPRIRLHASIFFRHVRCHFRKSDLVADAVALAWKWFRRLAARGKDATQFASTLASYAARAVRSGRRVTQQLKAKDVLSEAGPAAAGILGRQTARLQHA